LGGRFDADVALGAGDAEVVFVVGLRNESQLKLGGKVRHETLKDCLSRRAGRFAACGRCHQTGSEEWDREELLPKHAHQCSEI
jgi:hypothetical protein